MAQQPSRHFNAYETGMVVAFRAAGWTHRKIAEYMRIEKRHVDNFVRCLRNSGIPVPDSPFTEWSAGMATKRAPSEPKIAPSEPDKCSAAIARSGRRFEDVAVG